MLDEIQQDLQRGDDIFRRLKQIGGAFKAGVRISVGAGGGKPLKGVPLLALEQLMLQIVGDALRHLLHPAVGGGQGVIHRPIAGGKQRIGSRRLRLRPDQDLQPGGVLQRIQSVPGQGVLLLRHH